jgi:hypothetical protein
MKHAKKKCDSAPVDRRGRRGSPICYWPIRNSTSPVSTKYCSTQLLPSAHESKKKSKPEKERKKHTRNTHTTSSCSRRSHLQHKNSGHPRERHPNPGFSRLLAVGHPGRDPTLGGDPTHAPTTTTTAEEEAEDGDDGGWKKNLGPKDCNSTQD